MKYSINDFLKNSSFLNLHKQKTLIKTKNFYSVELLDNGQYIYMQGKTPIFLYNNLQSIADINPDVQNLMNQVNLILHLLDLKNNEIDTYPFCD